MSKDQTQGCNREGSRSGVEQTPEAAGQTAARSGAGGGAHANAADAGREAVAASGGATVSPDSAAVKASTGTDGASDSDSAAGAGDSRGHSRGDGNDTGRDDTGLSDAATLAELEQQLDEIDPREAEIAQLKDDLAHAQADFLNLQNEYGKYVRRAKAEAPTLRAVGHGEVAQSLLSVLDDIQAARDAGDLTDGPFAAIAAKLEATLESKFAVTRFGAAGDEFNPHLHEALMSQTSDEVEVATVGQVLQPGYRIGERVLRAAKVLVLNPA